MPPLVCPQEVGWYDEDRNASGVLASKLSSDALAVKGQFGDTMGLLLQVGTRLLWACKARFGWGCFQLLGVNMCHRCIKLLCSPGVGRSLPSPA